MDPSIMLIICYAALLKKVPYVIMLNIYLIYLMPALIERMRDKSIINKFLIQIFKGTINIAK